MPREESDIDIYVVLKDGTKNPILWLQDIHVGFVKHKYYEAVDVLANHKSRFEWRSKELTIERTVANKGVLLYAKYGFACRLDTPCDKRFNFGAAFV